MESRLFDRKCTLLVGKPPPDNFVQVVPDVLKITDLRIAFRIEKSDKPDPNAGEVQIFNLSDDSRAAIEDKGVRCVLSAGYPDTEQQIFSGEVLYASHVKVDRDWSTKLELGDGTRAYNYARVSQSFQPDTSFADVVKAMVKELGLDQGNTAQKLSKFAGVVFSKGFTMHGQASREMTRLLQGQGLTWSIQDGRIEILGADETLAESGPLIDPDHGLIGSPAFGTPPDKGKPALLKVKSLLQPSLRPGMKFKLDSSLKKGDFRVVRLVHTGDTFGGDWYTDIEARPA